MRSSFRSATRRRAIQGAAKDEARRSESLTAKVTPKFYEAWTAKAAERRVSPGELAREAVEWYLTRRPIEVALLSEMLATREIVINVQHDLAAQKPVTYASTKEYVDRADINKYFKADQRLRTVQEPDVATIHVAQEDEETP